MIITVNDIRAVRPMAQNLDDNRVEMYIREAEILDVVPAITAEVYEVLDAGENLTAEEQMMLNGGYYDAGCGKRMFEGIKVATAYLAYARFLRNNQVNVTPYGVVAKIGEESSSTEYGLVASRAAEAENIGRALLADAMRYWSSVTDACACGKAQRTKRKFVAIGK